MGYAMMYMPARSNVKQLISEKQALERRIDELCAEVERLHGEIRLNPLECALSEAQAFRGQVAALQAENAKLRELLDYVTPIAWYAASERERGRMRELGIEVRHG